MFHRLGVLQKLGYIPDLILDIGAYVGSWTNEMWRFYPEKNYILFEPIDYPQLRNMINSYVTIHNVILNDVCKEVEWYEAKNTGDSMFREKTHHFENCAVLKREAITLDYFFSTHEKERAMLEASKSVFIKIDCQGAEIPILRGASGSELLSKTDFIVLEMPFFGKYNEGVPSFLEHIKYMDDIGFVPFDMVETHYCNDINIQVDILFIRKTHELCKKVEKIIY